MNEWSKEIKIIADLMKVNEIYKKKENRLYSKSNLTFSQHNVLCILSAEKDGRSSMSGVSSKMVTTGGNLTGIAKRMEKKGLLKRERVPTDERKILLKIMPEGRHIVNDLKSEREMQAHTFLEHLSEKEKDELLKILRSLLNRL